MRKLLLIFLLLAPAFAQTHTTVTIEDTQTITGAKTISSAGLTAGNIAAKQFSGDNAIYVSSGGSDSNDGLSWGTAKLTPAAAITAVTSSGTAPGTIYLACGTYPGPSNASFLQNINIIGCSLPLGNLCGQLLCGPNNSYASGKAATVFQYSAALTIGSATTQLLNEYMRGIVFDFQNSGFGLTLQNVGSFVWDDVALYRCGDTTVPCLIMTTGTGAINESFNTLNRLTVNPRGDTTAHFATCVQLIGTGSVLTGHIVTDNRLNDLKCLGQLNDGVDFEINTDSNLINGFTGFQTLASPPAAGAWMAFNRTTPASDQDAGNGSIVLMSNLTGPTPFLASMGTTTGPIIITQFGAATPTVNVLGGTPQYSILGASLTAGTNPVFQITGRLGAGSALATGMVSGDVSASRTAPTGALFLGTDGNGFLFRNAVNTAQFQFGNSTWNYPALTTAVNVASNVVGALAALPACGAGTEGMHSVANNCNAACSSGGTCTAGGSTHCELYCSSSATYVETGR